MKNRNLFGAIGILIYLVLTLIDRVIVRIPDYIYIGIILVAMVMIIIGIIIGKKRGKKNEKVQHK